MNYEDILPPNWLETMTQSNQQYIQKAMQQNPFYRFVPKRICLDHGNQCPLKRHSICKALSHCILRYPSNLANFL